MKIQSIRGKFSVLLFLFALVFAYSNQAEATAPTGIKVTKSHQGNFIVGEEAIFTVVVSTDYLFDSSATSLTVTDTLPMGFSFVRATGDDWSASVTDSTVVLTYSEALASSESTTVYITVIPSKAGTFTNSVTANALIEDGAVEAIATDTVIVSDISTLSLSMSHAKKRFVVNRTGHFKISVGNSGSEDIQGPVTLINTLPNDIRLVEASGEGWIVTQVEQTIVMQYMGTLAAGGSAPLVKLKVRPKVLGVFTNTAVVTSQNAINAASDTVRVISVNKK